MKHIIKNAEPSSFIAWKQYKTTKKWSKLKKSMKDKLRDALLAEQGGICCYCEVELNKNFSHIEHIVPRASNKSLTFEYSNLLCSCQKNLPKGTPLQCGNAKGAVFNSKSFISPLEENCEQFLTYTSDGRVHGRTVRAKNTIKLLNLNEANLVKKREHLIDSFNDPSLSHEEIKEYTKKYLTKKKNGNYNEFWTTINFMFNN